MGELAQYRKNVLAKMKVIKMQRDYQSEVKAARKVQDGSSCQAGEGEGGESGVISPFSLTFP